MTTVTVHPQQPNVWIVDIGTHTYRAVLLDNGAWLVRNAWRRRYLPSDSPTLRRVVTAILDAHANREVTP